MTIGHTVPMKIDYPLAFIDTEVIILYQSIIYTKKNIMSKKSAL